jgi:hypothetical protein
MPRRFLVDRLKKKIVHTKLYDVIQNVLARLFPVKNYVIETVEEAEIWFQYEVSNHPNLDPFRPLHFRDSWAGKVKEKY